MGHECMAVQECLGKLQEYLQYSKSHDSFPYQAQELMDPNFCLENEIKFWNARQKYLFKCMQMIILEKNLDQL